MLYHENIITFLNTDFFDVEKSIHPDCVIIFTGPIDRFFQYRAGRLGWRTLDFERDVVSLDDFQGTSVMNYADEQVPYTRIHEFKHLHPERRYVANRTLIYREYSRFANDADEPFYPINTSADKDLYDIYRTMAKRLPNVLFGGRLGTYRYLDMHQAVGAALKVFERDIVPWFRERRPFHAFAADP
jgi:UDP-galactopyranose mutase